MKFVFRPLSLAAVYLKKHCQMIAVSMRRNGLRRSIHDGFIIEVSRKRDTCQATVIDTDVYFLSTRPLYILGDQRPPAGFIRKQRADYMSKTPTTEQDVTIPNVETLQIYQAPYPSVVGVPPAIGTNAPMWFAPQIRASVFADRACVGYTGMVNDASQFSDRQAMLDTYMVSWATPVGSFTDYPAEVSAERTSAWERVVLSESGLQALLGSEYFLTFTSAWLRNTIQIHGFSGHAAAGLRIEPPEPGGRVRRAAIILTPVYHPISRDPFDDRAMACELQLLALRITASLPALEEIQAAVTPDWHSMLVTGQRTGVADIGMASDGVIVSAVVAISERIVSEEGSQIGYLYTVTHHWFDAGGLRGSALQYSKEFRESTVDEPCELWLDIGEAGGAAYSAVLGATVAGAGGQTTGSARIAASKGGAVTIAPLPGWRPFTTVSRGLISVFNGASTGLVDPIRTTVLADLGDGQIGVLAAPSVQLDGNSGAADWHLIVLNAETLALIADRGSVVSMFWQSGSYAHAFQALSLTVISQQILDVAGNVTTAATLLVSVTEVETVSYCLLSTDGGATWGRMAQLTQPADVYYLGNKLHMVEPGKGL